ncbi:Hypothetical_protein [Hexamita inflata]|uniref:Hypothetical_protein n=1 Tax=Hexamita inflata TaxID=28002 RepID=A0AA86P123_9EUKA|nr:Hypothetical protein HINF_LOCUS7435 [Hexamita inflata]CAI9928474.1 Hypothetical protein HINF_LOCUS16119 [Hexamita inflata]
MQTIENIKYDKIEYKLTGQLLSYRGLVKQYITQSADKFDVSERIIKFSCGNMKGAQQVVCYQMLYDDLHSDNAVPTYNFDIMFFFQNKLIYLLKASNCLSRYTCWRNGIAVLKNTGLTLELERTYDCDIWDVFYDYSNVTSRLTVKNELQTVQYVEKYFQIVHSKNQNNFSWSCAELNCSSNQMNLTYSFEYDFGPFTAKFFVSKVEDRRKQFSKMWGLISGFAFLVLIFVVFRFKQFMTHQVIRKYRGYAKVQKQTQDQILLRQLVQSIQNKERGSEIRTQVRNQTNESRSLSNHANDVFSFAIE